MYYVACKRETEAFSRIKPSAYSTAQHQQNETLYDNQNVNLPKLA